MGEALESDAAIVKLVLAKRKGFVKIALQHGASLVPVFGFGENELFDQVNNPQGSTLRKVQNRLQQSMGFSMPLFHGRGVFQYDYGIMPLRVRKSIERILHRKYWISIMVCIAKV